MKPFTDHQIGLVQSFGAEAVLAMENAWLLNETREALRQQVAAATILSAINNSAMIEVFPQEITRVLLNLISNSFYAVNKRKIDVGGNGFEPLVTATTKGGADHVEIRIRDNGIGIPSDVKEKMFNPFFTTRPAGEGTGLGLSMSHDIIVKQRGGMIEVDTEPGEFSEFIIKLPRISNSPSKTRG